MNILLTLLSGLFFLTVGFVLIKKFNLLYLNDLEILPYSFGLGVGIISLQLFCYSLLRINWNLINILVPWLIIFVICKDKFNFKVNTKVKLSNINILLLLLIVSLVLFVGFESILRPLSAWDGWASWLLKSKIFFIDGWVNPNIFHYIESEYPPVISLMGTLVYIILGQIDDKAVILPFFIFYLSLGGVFFFSLRKIVGTTWSLVFTFLLLSIQNIIRHGGYLEGGQADLALGYYVFSSTMLLIAYIKHKSYKTFILLNIFLGTTALVKNEGLPFSIILELISLYYIIRHKNYKHLLIMLFWIIPIFGWGIFKNLNHLPNNYLLENTNIQVQRLGVILKEISKEFINIKNWNLAWVAFFVGFYIYLMQKKTLMVTILYLIIFVKLLVYVLIFMKTPINPIMHIDNVIDRLFIHLAPIAVFVTSIIYYTYIKKNE